MGIFTWIFINIRRLLKFITNIFAKGATTKIRNNYNFYLDMQIYLKEHKNNPKLQKLFVR